MKQSDLNRAVALATGETISTIKRLGFLLADPDDGDDALFDDQGPEVLDWDALDRQRFDRNIWGQRDAPATA
ncbi:hypothetical protein [Lignipirellula cremea]|uniref:Uncharacterized protein n=1 Tax=Lignipirellula cremea TaxID=2528010 RepID=A0A518DRK5_9BACT|nr:hypothetical protein [Lignipirellula cremea]QDU94477.1 hypothetical protein Pla8534_22680 [Lignipirellula cremea]